VSDDQHFETFVSPLLDDALLVVATQVHELCHCAAGLECKHRKPFTTIAKKLGLEGKMTATTAGDELQRTLKAMIDDLGPYPHAKLVHSTVPKKQSTRMILVKCPECGYQVRTTRKWLDVGVPTCPCGVEMQAEEPEEPEEPEDGE
jgi:hypothetical protein